MMMMMMWTWRCSGVIRYCHSCSTAIRILRIIMMHIWQLPKCMNHVMIFFCLVSKHRLVETYYMNMDAFLKQLSLKILVTAYVHNLVCKGMHAFTSFHILQATCCLIGALHKAMKKRWYFLTSSRTSQWFIQLSAYFTVETSTVSIASPVFSTSSAEGRRKDSKAGSLKASSVAWKHGLPMWMMGFRGNLVVNPSKCVKYDDSRQNLIIHKNSELMAIYTTSTLAMEPEKGVPSD